ncbi:exonuclease 1 isoform X2 [Exaiptasia diaphana]|uniref:Exonuclease 1 n=1 Tax=Exaiptasia diaphana TaxID=2652724 RepID=A0A913X6I8_EXADI|nr:exonuclease 1 isoform X2 [Exaiptasia diaphana]
MGIQGLLPLLKPIQKDVHLSKFSGQTIGVDTYCWLHKGAYGCAMDIVEGKQTKVYLNYVIKRLEMMLYYNIKPYVVLDGGHLPSKASKEAERRKTRQENKAKGLAFLRAGNKTQACECFQKCVDVTPEMALEVIKVCRERNIDYLVAPYEADSQLAYLMKTGITQAVISEDSDLLVYGCKKVIFKMDEFGDGTLIDLDDLPKLKDLKMHEFTLERFRHMCILSGCDYLPSIKGIGLKTANKLVRKHSTITKLVRNIRLENKLKVPDNYEKNFQQADETFLYQMVFDPISQSVVPLTPLPDGVLPGQLNFAGSLIPKENALAIALGNVNPITNEIMDDYDPLINKIDKSEIKIDMSACSNNSSCQQSLTPSTANTHNGEDPTTGCRRFLLPPLNRTRLKENDNASEEKDLIKMYTFLKQKKPAISTERKQSCCHSRKQRLKNPFRLKSKNMAPGRLSSYFVNMNSTPENVSKSIFSDLPSLAEVCIPLPSYEEEELQKENSQIDTFNVTRTSPGKIFPSALQIDYEDSRLQNGRHKDVRATPNGYNESTIPVANKPLRVLNVTSPNPSSTATPLRSLNKFVYKPKIKSNDKVTTKQDSAVTDSGCLSDNETEAPPDGIVKKHIQWKPISSRCAGFSRCKQVGLSKRKSKTRNGNDCTTLFNYFEYTKAKKPRLDA